MSEVISPRGSSVCRGCGSTNLTSVINLGTQPLPAEYGFSSEDVLDVFPLHMRICTDCGLGQLGEYVMPERIFHDTYPYISSASSTWVEHSKMFASDMKEKLELTGNNLVLELASNDGYLLSAFQHLGIKVLGVEPAHNVACLARSAGIETLIRFFGAGVAKDILKTHGYPSLIVANNVFAHIPDMNDFIEGMALLADNQTVITIENPSFTELLKRTLFDTIYHEHYSYLTAHSVKYIAHVHGLVLFHVDQLQTHGGSNRYWLSRTHQPDETVAKVLAEEIDDGLFDPRVWHEFATRANTSIDRLRAWFLEKRNSNEIVVGYGAAHKGNTFLNSVGDLSKTLKYVVDASPEKQGKFLPGSQVPVLSPEQLNSANPTDVLILPWNIAPELSKLIRKLAPNSRVWVAQPSMHQL